MHSDTDVRWDELFSALGRFGFAERESRLYLLLLRRGAAKVSDLTKEVGVDRVHAYRLLDAMRSRGLVQTTAERPRRYVALPPHVLFERSLFERRRALEEDVLLAQELERRLPELTSELSVGAPRFQVLTGAASVYPFLKQMVERSKRSLDVMITPRAFRDSTRFGVSRALPPFLRTGGRLRMVVELDPRIEAFVRRLRVARRKFPGIAARGLLEQRARLTIADGREAIVFLVPETGRGTVEETAVWTDNPDFVRAQQGQFDAVWNVARELPTGSPRGRARG